ncbi:MAG TPA: MBL fold metallo-hydrolase, partial [Chloroflexota bacterium]|nr:MBL fold metallo-hydrolase [Chloroflexota bacterium]
PGELDQLEHDLGTLGVKLADVKCAVITHGHADHAGGNGELRVFAPQVAVAIHPADKDLLGGPEAHLRSPVDAAAAMRLMGREDMVHEREAVLRRVVGRSTGVDRELADGDVVDLGDDVRLNVVHTPGHTSGSVCYYWESGATVFSGDAVQGHGWRAGMAPIYHDVCYLDSLTRIGELGADVLCMGHTFGWSGVLNDPVRHGTDIGLTLDASRRASAAIDHAASTALEQLGPHVSFLELAQAAFRELVYDLPLVFDRRTLVPPAVARAIRAHLEAQGWRAPSP